jgi:hypothetical protein
MGNIGAVFAVNLTTLGSILLEGIGNISVIG